MDGAGGADNNKDSRLGQGGVEIGVKTPHGFFFGT